MTTGETLRRIVDGVTPDRVEAIVRRLAAELPFAASGVTMSDVVEALMGDADLGKGPERWSAHLKIKRAAIAALEAIPTMRYIEGDA